ncbi:Crp/Fnr family transcriptional regulator [Flavobacterium saccharophilum]|uniref:cAMP-binding domain of CRP or a regulatory subunit of cAMP-dependent protein kinases n=1 Tax=Flavobacterium saccharophilum TaxID=29534 RepID=A0A1M7L7I7_9FLAO|nr:Crp/Fnr family transcriptional regulator [Flavobacterium saccharophilum]SHM73950.1 cAMP-binding domain of CRP or a regulatory subunit of cAMP-dependent protein kinases [Flavobacterium saccharophilum]
MLEQFKKYIIDNTGLSENEYKELEHLVYSLEAKKGTVLLKENQICNKAFFVCKGMLRSYTVDEMGKDHIIQFASENWWIADRSSFYFDEPSELFIDVIEDAEIVYIHKEFIKTAEKLSKNFVSFNTLALQKNIRQMQKRINYLLAATAEKKYLDFIETHREITYRLPLQMIASYLGITPESLSRVRKELARKNFKP